MTRNMKTSGIKKSALSLVAVVALGAALVGCGQNDDTKTPPPQLPPATEQPVQQSDTSQMNQDMNQNMDQGMDQSEQPAQTMETQPAPSQVTSGANNQ